MVDETTEKHYQKVGQYERLPRDMAKRAATDYVKIAVHMFQNFGVAKGQQKFTEFNRENLIENLAKLRMLMTQADAGQRGEGVNQEELEFIQSHIVVETMCMWLAGKLDMVEVDEEEIE